MDRLTEEFYQKDAFSVAQMLLGCFLCRRIDGKTIKLRITETECYCGEQDTACHAHKGRTGRTEILYSAGGVAYVYLCYGIHNLLNVVTGHKEHPEAVLIRGVEGYSGPGRLTKALKIDRTLNGISFLTSDEMWIESDGHKPKYTAGKRVGIDYAAAEDRDKPWRFMVC